MLAVLPALFFLGHSLAPSPVIQAPVLLVKGAVIPGVGIHDQDVEETVLDTSEPKQAHGGYYTLATGPSKTLLVRFGQLKRHLAQCGRITDAELVLTPESSTPFSLKSVGRVLKAWGQGPALRLDDVLSPRTVTAGAKTAVLSDVQEATWGAATWQEAQHDVRGAKWQSAGARGAQDVEPIDGAKLKQTDDGLVISGLGPAVSAMLQGENNGLALVFDSVGSVYSSNSPVGKPILRIWADPVISTGPDVAISEVHAGGDGLSFVLKNVGDQPSGPFTVVWSADGVEIGREESSSLGALESRTVTHAFAGRGDDKDHRKGALKVTLVCKDYELRWDDKEFTYYPKGAVVKSAARPADIEFLNQNVLARSRYGASPDGCLERARPAETLAGLDWKKLLLELGAPDLATDPKPRFADLTGGGDTRYDGALTRSSSLPQANFFSPILLTTPADPTYLVAPNSVFALNAGLGNGKAAEAALHQWPLVAAIRATDAMGLPIAKATLQLGEQTLTTGSDGTALLPNGFKMEPAQAIPVALTQNGVTETDWLYGWQFNAAAQRGAKVAFIDLRFAVPGETPDYSRKLSEGRDVSDSSGRASTELASITADGSKDVSLPSEEGQWIEIDLRRDRTLTEVRLTGGWERFDIVVYNTGQKPEEAVLWAREEARSVSSAVRGGGKPYVAYRGKALQARFIRLINKRPCPNAIIRQVEVFGKKVSE